MEEVAIAHDLLRAAGEQLVPLLSQTGADIVDIATDRVAGAVVGTGGSGLALLWRRLRGRAVQPSSTDADSSDLAQAARFVAADPHDAAARDQLATAMADVLARHPALLADAIAWLNDNGDGLAPGDVAGPRAVQARNVINSTIVTGDRNRIR